MAPPKPSDGRKLPEDTFVVKLMMCDKTTPADSKTNQNFDLLDDFSTDPMHITTKFINPVSVSHTNTLSRTKTPTSVCG